MALSNAPMLPVPAVVPAVKFTVPPITLLEVLVISVAAVIETLPDPAALIVPKANAFVSVI